MHGILYVYYTIIFLFSAISQNSVPILYAIKVALEL